MNLFDRVSPEIQNILDSALDGHEYLQIRGKRGPYNGGARQRASWRFGVAGTRLATFTGLAGRP